MFAAVAIVTLLGVPVHASPSANRLLNYQLRLTDASGIPVADGTYNLKISFYDAASSGTRLHTDCGTVGTPVGRKVVFSGGVGSVLIGDTAASGTTNCADASAPNAIAATLFDADVLYLGVTVGAEVSEMTPRKRIVATGYSLNADRLDDLDTSAAGGSNAFVPVTDSSGNFTLTRNVTVDTNTFFVNATSNSVGVGTVSPSGVFTVKPDTDNEATLKIEQQNATDGWEMHVSNSAGMFRMNRTGSSAGERLTIANTGEVGIGDTSPGSGFGTSGTTGQLSVVRTSSGATMTGLNLINAASATNTAIAIDFTPNTNVTLARINATRTNTGGAGTTDFVFSNYRGATATLTDNMRIAGDTGYVGIGTASPGSTLHLQQQGGSKLRFNSTTNTGYDNSVSTDTNSHVLNYTTIGSHQFVMNNDSVGGTSDGFTVQTGSLAGALRFRIDSDSGNVGIGDSTPDALLDVAGTFQTDGSAVIGDASGDTLTINGTAVSAPNNLNVDANTLFVDAANNRVGIGTASPAATFSIADGSFALRASASTGLQVNTSGAQAWSNFGSTNTAPALSWYNSSDHEIGQMTDGGSFSTPYGGFGRYGNSLLRSEEFDNASWTKESTIVITANGETAPDYSQTADRVSTAGAAATSAVLQAASDSFPSVSSTWTASVWMRMTTGSATVNLRISSTNESGTASPAAVTTSWRRFRVTQAFTGSSTGTATFRIETGTNANVVLWGGQLERSEFLATYAKTIGSAITSGQRGFVANSSGNHYIADGVLGVGVPGDAEYRITTGSGITGAFYGITTGSTVAAPQIDLQDTSTSHETVLTSQDGAATTGTFLASWSNHPLMFGTNAASTSSSKMTLSAAGDLSLPGNGAFTLGSKSSDPTGANGMTFYNTTSNKFRCYENGAWKDCDTGGGSGASIGGAVTSGTAGSVLFVNAGPVLAQDNANFFFDDSTNRLGIGDATPAATLTVGSGDLFQVDSSGNVDTNAHAAIGATASTNANTLINVSETFSGTATGKTGLNMILTTNPSGNTSSTFDGIYTDVTTSGAGSVNFTGRLAGIESNVVVAHSGTTNQAFAVNGEAYYTGSSTVAELIGVYGAASDSGTGSVTDLYGFYSNLYLDGLTGTNSYGLRVYQSGTPTSLTNNYGIYIDPVAGGTSAYSLYSNGGQSYFAGNVGVGDSTPDGKLDVAGSSGSDVSVSIDNAGSGDATLYFRASEAAQFVMGFDNSTSNNDFVISRGGALGTTNMLSLDGAGGDITMTTTGQVYLPTGNLTLNPGNLNFSNSYEVNWGAAGAGNYFNWKIPRRSGSNVCSSGGTTEGIIIKDDAGTQVGHICIDGPTGGNKLRYYAESYSTTATDLAEMYSTRLEDGLQAGDVVELDPSGDLMVRKSSAPSSKAFGVISDQPGLMLSGIDEATGNADTTNGRYVALKGRVPVRVSMENGPIEVGDYLAASSTPGVAMKSAAAGHVIGRALDATNVDGTVRVFVEVGHWDGDGIVPSGLGDSLPALELMTRGIDMAGHDIANVGALSGLNGAWSFDAEGRLVLKEVRAEKYAVTQTDAVRTIDSATIPSGASHVQVHNASVGAMTKVFVTFRKNPGSAWWIDEVMDGMFVLKTAQPVTEDVTFDYWLISVDDRRTPPTAPEQAPVPVDTDNDGLSDEQEVAHGTNPNAADTDLDGFPDGEEIASGHDPLHPPEPAPTPTSDGEPPAPEPEPTPATEPAPEPPTEEPAP